MAARMTRVRRKWFAAVLTVVLAAVTVATPRAQETFSLFVRVVDGSGSPISALQPEEVVILEDGIERDIAAVEVVDWPVRLFLLVDNSAVMLQSLGQVREGLRDFVAALPEGISVELVTTSPQPRFIVRMTSDLAEVVAGIATISPDRGQSAFVDSLVEASDRIRDFDQPHFPVVVMLAANGPDPALIGGIDRKFERLVRQTAEQPVIFHFIVWSAPGRAANQVVGSVQTVVGTRLADMSGGRYESLAAASRIATLLPEIGAEVGASHLRQSSQFRVRYMRPPDAQPPQQTIDALILRDCVQGTFTFDGRLP